MSLKTEYWLCKNCGIPIHVEKPTCPICKVERDVFKKTKVVTLQNTDNSGCIKIDKNYKRVINE